MTVTHKHKCPECGSVWEHPDFCGMINCDENHACPKCGADERYKCSDRLETDFKFVKHEGRKPIYEKAK